jgi:hypothetical protein
MAVVVSDRAAQFTPHPRKPIRQSRITSDIPSSWPAARAPLGGGLRPRLAEHDEVLQAVGVVLRLQLQLAFEIGVALVEPLHALCSRSHMPSKVLRSQIICVAGSKSGTEAALIRARAYRPAYPE